MKITKEKTISKQFVLLLEVKTISAQFTSNRARQYGSPKATTVRELGLKDSTKTDNKKNGKKVPIPFIRYT